MRLDEGRDLAGGDARPARAQARYPRSSRRRAPIRRPSWPRARRCGARGSTRSSSASRAPSHRRSCYTIQVALCSAGSGKEMKPPIKRPAGGKPSSGQTQTYARPTPKASRRKTAKVLTPEERAAFLASRPDLASKP
jgi:hypothetical protein